MRVKIELKYRIKERLDLLTHAEFKSIINVMPKALNISQRTFYRYMYTRINDKYSMPVDHLAQLARFFNCRIEDMLNFDPPPLMVKEIKHKGKNELAKKFKLVK